MSDIDMSYAFVREQHPIAQHPGYLSGAPRFPGHRIAIGQWGRHLLDGGTMQTFLFNYHVASEKIVSLFDLLPDVLDCGVSRQQIADCVTSELSLEWLYEHTSLTAEEAERVLKKSWLWDEEYAFWWGD